MFLWNYLFEVKNKIELRKRKQFFDFIFEIFVKIFLKSGPAGLFLWTILLRLFFFYYSHSSRYL
nr:MAG TPA: hypothetical protein [Caudoviricetes sp.]